MDVRGWTLLMGNTRPECFLRGLKFSDNKIRGLKFLGIYMEKIRDIRIYSEKIRGLIEKTMPRSYI